MLEAFPDSHSTLIHEADIAVVALQGLTGPRSLTAQRQAELIGEAINQPIRVERQDLDDYRRTLSRWSPEIVEARIRRIAALVDHPAPTTDTVREVTGRPPRTFAHWAVDHASNFIG